MSSYPRDVHVTLICKELPPIDEPVEVGIQDKGQNVYPGRRRGDGAFAFECLVEVRAKDARKVDFFGPFVHGTPGARFLYLSWKRPPGAPASWLQRVKVPLALAAADLGAADAIQADITGRRPHATEPIDWTAAPAKAPRRGGSR